MTVIIDGTAGITFPNSTTQAVAGAPLTTPSFTTTIGVGAATASANGAGVTFPATQSGSSNANTLDDYEEGTFTPVASQLSSNPTVTYSTQTGSYVKVGNTVTINIRIGIGGISGGSGQTQITGLPFSSTTSGDGGIMFMQSNNGAGTAGRYLMAYIGSNVTKLEIYNNDPTSGFAQPTSYPVNFNVIISFSYIANT